MSCLPLLRPILVPAIALLLLTSPASAVVDSTLRGVVHDPAHRPIAGAHIHLSALHSAFVRDTVSDPTGEWDFTPIPLGQYQVRIEAPGFRTELRELTLASGDAPVLHMQLAVAGPRSEVTVQASPTDLSSGSAARTDVVSREQIADFAGADLSNSLRLITEFVPGATVVHDQLHVRGGHQVTWAINGVPLPNTNIASNVGPQFSPRDIDTMEVETGSYNADYGDRTYGVFNVATRTGFERDREAELVTTFGNFNQTDDQLSLGDHSATAAYYVSLSGNRTDYALEPPTARNLHNQGSGGGAFTSLLIDPTAADQLRFTGAFRADFYQVPNDPDAQAAGVRDREREQDGFATLTWSHTLSPRLSTELSPFIHLNRAAFVGGPVTLSSDPDNPAQPSATSNRLSSYEGGQALVSSINGSSNLRAGVYAFAQQDNTLFSVTGTDDASSFRQQTKPGGRLVAAFAQEQWRARSWLTLTGGLRFTSFSGNLAETASDPRIGIAVPIPRLGWVARASYARFYQAPPLDTVTGPVLALATSENLGFLALHGERDEQHDFGLTIPLHGWMADFDQFRTAARNFFDHDSLGNSDIFLPLTIARARITGWESSVRSPLLAGRVRAHLVYSNQQAEGFGAVTGGLTDFSPPPDLGPNGQQIGFYLDHDQRNTLSAGLDAPHLPWHTSGSFALNYGSGFLDGDGPGHLPSYRTLDLSLAKSIGERLSARIALTNFTDKRFQLDNSNTFGGTHFGDPRMLYGELRWRFHY